MRRCWRRSDDPASPPRRRPSLSFRFAGRAGPDQGDDRRIASRWPGEHAMTGSVRPVRGSVAGKAGKVLPEAAASAVAQYKSLLQKVLDNRPSGTRGRLATALGKNRSFITQITNPAYQVPIPRQHIESVFEICHFSHDEKREFLKLYGLAHPGRLEVVPKKVRMRTFEVAVPDLGSSKKNKAIEAL